jgi:hypothetical protein
MDGRYLGKPNKAAELYGFGDGTYCCCLRFVRLSAELLEG